MYLILNEQSFNYNTLPRNDRISTGPDATIYKMEDNVKYKSVRKLSDYYLSTACSQQTDNEEIKYEEEPTNFNIWSECQICDLYMESKGMYKKVDLKYPWIDIISFKAPVSTLHSPTWNTEKKCRWDEINFNTIFAKIGDNLKLIKNKSSEYQPFLFISK